MGRSPCCDESGLKKGPWTLEEDEKLVNYVQKHRHSSWTALPKLAGLNRCGKSCRLRWINYLRPDIKRGRFSQDEEQTILNLHELLGNKWSTISNHLPGRTDNEIKNFWHTHLKKKLIHMGIDPMTHRPRTDSHKLMSLPSNLKGLLDLQQHDQDHAILIKLHTEMMTKIQLLQYLLQPPFMNNIINPNDINTLSLLLNSIASFKETSKTLQDFEPASSVFTQNLDHDNHFKFFTQRQNLPLDPIWLSDPSSLTQSLLVSHDPSCSVSDDLIRNQYVNEDVNSNITLSSCQGSGASASTAWPDHLLDDSLFSDIA